MRFKILVAESRSWTDSTEGPFETFEEALAFAHAEVGVPWLVVDADGDVAAYGDQTGVVGEFENRKAREPRRFDPPLGWLAIDTSHD